MRLVGHLWRYGMVAATCAFLNIVVLIAGDAIGAHYALATLVSFVLCVLIGYRLHSRYTFASDESAASLYRYTFAMALNLPGALLAIWVFYDLMSLQMTIAAPSATIALSLVNYLFSSWAITGKLSS